jgi:hypothetical protein
MKGAPLPVSCTGLPEALATSLLPLAESAGRDLELGHDFSALAICADALPGDEGAWYRLQPAASPDQLPVLCLFCHKDCFGPGQRGRESVMPAREIWEQSPAPAAGSADPEGNFDQARSESFLYHHLLTARDLVRGVVNRRNLPAGLAEAFSEAWAVCVDGRLARMSLPGYPLAERRARFARVFSPAGILIPDHWQVFQSLWDGALADQKEVLAVLKWLPGL